MAIPGPAGLPAMATDALRALPSYGHHEFVFAAKPNPRFKANFKTPCEICPQTLPDRQNRLLVG
jgi:hypothetical protein